jgi:translocation and assembly module TamA
MLTMVCPAFLTRRAGKATLVLGMALVVPAGETSRAADPQPYEVTIAPTGDAKLDTAISGSSVLVSLREKAPVGPFALVARAQQDAGRFRTALDSFGYYGGGVTITVAGRPVDDPGLPDLLDRAPADPPVAVAVKVEPGTRFRLGTVALDGAVPADAREKLDLAPGQPAIAADVLAARSRLLDALRNQGYAMATVSEPHAVLRESGQALDIGFTVATGPKVDLGPISISGLHGVSESYVRNRLLIHQGEQFSPLAIEKARQDLAAQGVFASVRAVPATDLDPRGELPVAIIVTERKRHVVTLGAAYSTDLGAALTATWSDRNLFGNAEQLNITAGTQGGGTAQKNPGYNAQIQFIEPDFLTRDQQLQASVNAVKQSLQAYDQKAVGADIGLNRKFSDHWSGSAGLSFVQERITQEDVGRDYTLFGIPVTARYDSTDSVFEPTKGIRASATVTPTQSFGHSEVTFLVVQGQASTYLDLDTLPLTETGRSNFAFRGLVGSALGASQFELPADRRFYAGGSATVRGYRFQSVGPHFTISNTNEGGTSVLAGTVEYRQRILESFGAAVFMDAGQVTADGPPGGGTWRVGTGFGARYYTPIGPIRADIAFPLSHQPGSDSFEIYIGIGEAF